MTWMLWCVVASQILNWVFLWQLRKRVAAKRLSIHIVNNVSKEGAGVPASSYVQTSGSMNEATVRAIEQLWKSLQPPTQDQASAGSGTPSARGGNS